MNIERRDLLKASAAIAGALALSASGLIPLQKALAKKPGPPPIEVDPIVIWLQGQSCTGCSVSLLNSVYDAGSGAYLTIDELLINTLSMKFHPTVMAAADDLAVDAAEAARTNPDAGYILVIEGAIPTGANGDYCHIWPGMTMIDAIGIYGPSADGILAVGTCACYGGMSAGEPNPTDAMGVKDALSSLGHNKVNVINIPGCPAHPDWIVGTIASLLAGQMPALDKKGRPKEYFRRPVHGECPNRGLKRKAKVLGDYGCLTSLGCKGRQTYADCPVRRWNAGLGDAEGVNWCIGAQSPCQGCTEPDFPDGKSPFYTL